jgi:copper ion binding protein
MERTVNVQNISCGHCVQSIRREVGEIPGVQSVDADIASGRATVAWDAPATWEQVVETLIDIGYPPAE